MQIFSQIQTSAPLHLMRGRNRAVFNKFQNLGKKSQKCRITLRILNFFQRIRKFPQRIFRLSKRIQSLLAQFKIVLKLFKPVF